jgi:hypothetical protein
MGAAARAAVVARYDWQRNLARIGQCIDAPPLADPPRPDGALATARDAGTRAGVRAAVRDAR